jgi:hypothetical protein
MPGHCRWRVRSAASVGSHENMHTVSGYHATTCLSVPLQPAETIMRTLGSLLQIGALIVLLGLIPYSLFAGYKLYLVASSWTAASAGPFAYAMARVVACIILIYALWQLRKTGLRLRKHNPPGR